MKVDAVRVQTEMAKQAVTVEALAQRVGILEETLRSVLIQGKCRYSTIKKICAGLGLEVFDVIRR